MMPANRFDLPLFPRVVVLVGIVLILVLASILPLRGATADGTKATSSVARPALTVALEAATTSDWPRTLLANGNIAAWQEAIVGAEVTGLRIAELRASVGDWVRKGQTLATFAAETVEVERAQTAALVAEAEAALAEAEANAARARSLADSGALSAQQINQFLTAEKTARARLAAARAQARASELRLAQTRLLAPDDGIVAARSATVGAVVSPGVELFRLIRQGRLEWRAEVTAAELGLLQAGQSATVELPGGTTVKGRVRQLAPTVDRESRTALVYVDLERSPAARAGAFARGVFELGRAPALTVPQSAVVLRDGYAWVFRAESAEGGVRVRQVKVETGRRNGERVEIVSGLRSGEQVVASGAAFLSDGDTVRVAAASKTPMAAPVSPGMRPAAATGAARG